MVLGAGSKVGPYEILGALGAGGMGEVYRGRDPKLNRTIAIKVLSGEYSRDAGRLARFEQEARAASALNHPNIVTIYDVGQSDGTAYIAMEFVDGRTLREALEGGALPLKKALAIAAQVADGLAKAHQAGLVHRDLKPENVMVTGDGLVKILDFGLVKLVTPGSGEPVGATATAVVPATHPGMVLGTVGYMSPEQARGREVDFRSDQFSLGTLLYEMLTGKRPFHRESSAQTMAAIIEDEPRPVSEVNPKVPAPVRWIVERCLAKEAEERYASTRDLARDLQRVRDHLSEASTSSQFGAVTAAAPAPSRSKRRMWATAAAGVAGLLLGLAIGRTMRRGETQPTALRTLTFSGSDLQPSVSRDGRMVAFTSLRDGKSRIWVKQLPGAGEAPITSGPNDGNARFSPDGTMLLFIRRESGVSWVCRTAVVGGETKKVIRGEWADWSPDGKQIGVLQRDTDPAQDTTSVLVSDVDGGHAKTLQRVSGELLSGLRWSPDGNWLAMVTRHFGLTAEGEKIVLVSGDGKERKQVDPLAGGDTSNVAWIGPEELVYARARQTTGSGLSNLQTPTSVVRQNVRTGERRILLWVPNAVIDVEAVPGGGIIFDVMSGGENVRETVMRGGRADPNQEKMLTRGNSNDRQPVYGSDDEWLAFSSNRTNNLDVWAVSSKSGEVRRLTDDPTDDWDPAFTADGKQLVWSAHRSGNYEIWMADADGSGAHQVTHDGVDAENPIPTVDGWIVYNSGNPAHRGIRKIRVDGTQDQAVPGVVGDWPEVSRDGQYVMVVVHGPSASHLAIHRLSDGGLVMTVPLMTPLAGRSYWMPDGKTILYDDSVSADTGFPNTRGSIYAQDFIPGKDTSATRRPVLDWLKQGGVETFAVSHDGERIAYAVVEMSTSLMEAEGIEDK